MSRVFFPINNSKFNTDQEFGEAKFIFTGGDWISPLRTDEYMERVKQTLEREEFDPNIDFIGLTGSQPATALLLTVASIIYGNVQICAYEASVAQGYVTRSVNIEGIELDV